MTRLRADCPVADVLDRLTILAIKAARLPEERAASCCAEADALRAVWAEAGLPTPESVPEHGALAEVNLALWDVEDRLRAREAAQDFGSSFVEDARSVYRLNDRRAALKRALNERSGSAFMEEKLHPAYAAASKAAADQGAETQPAAPTAGLTHLDADGNPRMVDVGEKAVTRRTATAEAFVSMSAEARARLASNPKGDALAVARIAGIQGAKRTADLIPLCHPLPLDGVEVSVDATPAGVRIRATTRTTGRTGVEMEALTAASVAALTVYDMLKAVDRGLRIDQVRLLEKSGGRSGTWRVS